MKNKIKINFVLVLVVYGNGVSQTSNNTKKLAKNAKVKGIA